MPAQSEPQRRLFGAALAVKRGEVSLASLPMSLRRKVQDIIKNVSEDEIRKFAKARTKLGGR